MKGIILAGGTGTRLWPVTRGVCKQLLPVYDKPMIYYPLSTLMLLGIREILIITAPSDTERFSNLLGDGSHLGLQVTYAVQPHPEGIAQAFIIGRPFVGNHSVTLILGDNIFYGQGLMESLKKGMSRPAGATIFAYQVRDPQHYGVVAFGDQGKAISLEEKPAFAKSPYAITGLYMYDNDVLNIASELKPSGRNELEITDVNLAYLQAGSLWVEKLGRGAAWLDTGTPESLLQASNFIQTLQERQGLMVACVEEIAYKLGYISSDAVQQASEEMKNNAYGHYLRRMLEQGT